jgi:glycine cleavage system H protein
MSEYLQTVVDKFEFRVRKRYYYTRDDLWVSPEGAKVRIGVTDYLQRTVGDVGFVEIAKPSSIVEKQTEIGTLETAKTTISLLSPIGGQIQEINEKLAEKPELVNADPYGEGWLALLAPHDLENQLKGFLNAEDYFKLMLERLRDQREKSEGERT